MATYYSVSHSPRRLAERRGIPQLQPLEPAHETKTSIPTRMSFESDTGTLQSVASSGSRYSTDDFSSQLSTPATPTDFSPFRSSALDAFSPVTAPPSIREEDEDEQECNCDCEGYPEGPGMRGLGFDMDGISKQTSAMRLSEILYVATGNNRSPNYEYSAHYDTSDSRGQFPMPPTPPSHAGERSYACSETRSPILRPQKSVELIIDPECFSSGPSSAPPSPASESSRSRAATILNKVVSYKLRASLKRRMSTPNTASNQPPPVPAVSTMPGYVNPTTPPDDIFDDFFRKNDDKSSKVEDAASVYSNGEMPLPPLLHPAATFSGEMEFHASPLGSPRYMATPTIFGTDMFLEMHSSPISSELVSSPLHPPTISPLMSPSLASVSQTSLNTFAPYVSMHKKVPSIDPATPLAPRRPPVPPAPVSADSLADMIEEMNTDLGAYDATRALMIESGWSSPQEIKNVEAQRADKERTWKERIAESKKVLEVMRRTEFKNDAVSSVSSIYSTDSPVTSHEPMPITPFASFPDTQSLRSFMSSERTLSR